MKAFTITREHIRAGFIFLAIFALAAVMFLTSCSTIHEGTTCPCSMSKHFVGYSAGGYNRGCAKN